MMDKYKVLEYLTRLEMNTIKQQKEIKKPFNSLGELNAWCYIDGYLDALKTIKGYIKGIEKK
jgi:hypothetical protein